MVSNKRTGNKRRKAAIAQWKCSSFVNCLREFDSTLVAPKILSSSVGVAASISACRAVGTGSIPVQTD